MPDFGTIAVGVRCGGRPDGLFFKCWTQLLCSGVFGKGDAVLSPSIELPHHWTANCLVHDFMNKTQCDSLLLIDDDMVFEPSDFVALREHRTNYDYDMVQGLCCSRRPGHKPVLLGESPNAADKYRMMHPETGDTTVEVAMLGMAFTLIRRSVFEAISDKGPMFFRWGPDGRGEDTLFCQDARAAGKRLGVDCRVSIGHRVATVVEWDTENEQAQHSAHVDNAFRDVLSELE